MKTKYFFLAAAAALFAACSSDDGIAEQQQQAQQQANQVPVAFDSYVGRATTRAGVAGATTETALKTGDMKDVGFGVFAYYTNDETYGQSSIPNFMYNQQVKWQTSPNPASWTYTPVKYWPNEYGSEAASDDADKVSFFAYAPWVQVAPATGKLSGTDNDATSGIVALSRNSSVGDPLVKYIGNFTTTNYVDLCWGVYKESAWNLVQTGAAQDGLTSGMPWLDVQRPKGVDQKLKFTFNHALAQLNIQIDADVDLQDHGESDAIAGQTKVYVRSFTIEGIAEKGTLNLNNTEVDKANWLDFNGNNAITTGEGITIYDGLRDGKEGVAGATATNEKTQGLNPKIIQGGAGVIAGSYTNLFARWDEGSNPPATSGYADEATAANPILVIPTGEPVKITIVYDIETTDPNLPTYISDRTTHGSSIENRIEKEITWTSGEASTKGLESGKKIPNPASPWYE